MVQQMKPTDNQSDQHGGWENWLRWRVLETPSLGLFCIVLGGGALWIAREYPYGTLIEMGPGFVPSVVALLLAFFGVLILILRGRDVDTEEERRLGSMAVAHDPLKALGQVARVTVFIMGGIVVFGLTLRLLGLALSTFLLVIIAGFAQKGAKPLAALLTAAGITIVACFVFVTLLGMEVPLFPKGL